MSKILVALTLSSALAAGGCMAFGYKQLKLKGTNKGIAAVPANFGKLEGAASAQGWGSKRGNGTSEPNLTITLAPAQTIIFTENVRTNIMAYQCQGVSGAPCKDALNKLLVRAFGLASE